MIINYLKLALRKFWRHRTFSLINLFGLTMGTVCCLYILFYVQEHRSYDRHHVEVDQLYRLTTDLDMPGESETLHLSTSSPPIAPTMQRDFPEVEVVARMCPPIGQELQLLKVGDRSFYEDDGFFVDSTFFQLMEYDFVMGDPLRALDAPFSMVVSEELARKLFGREDPMGQVVEIGASPVESFTVSGVFSTKGVKSHIDAEYFMAMNSGALGQYVRSSDSWAGNNFVRSYIRLQPGADAAELEAKLPAFLESYGADQLTEIGMEKALSLQPLTEIHTTTGLANDSSSNTSSTFLTILLLIGGFIQLVACINFMNLTTARATTRMQEVGVRKAIRAPRGALIGQFLGESIFLSLLAMLFAVPITHFLLPYINELVQADISFNWHWGNLTMILGLLILTGLLAGSYPAFYLSAFKPVTALRGAKGRRDNSVWLRKSLIVGQLAIALILVISALVIRTQLQYMLNKDLGFETNQKVVFHFHTQRGAENLELYQAELHRLAEVDNVSAMSRTPGQFLIQDIPMYKEGQSMATSVDIPVSYVDENYFETLKVELLSGRALSMSDTTSEDMRLNVVVNESAIKGLGIPLEEAPGQTLYSDFQSIHIRATIVGVMEDFLFQNLENEIGPFMVAAEPPRNLNNLVAAVNTSDYSGFLAKAETLWNRVIPDLPFAYSFLDENIAQLYETEQTLSRIISAFTLVAILIACLGLFGLSTFAAEQRRKEISIRKVLGASMGGIVGLLSRDFLRLVFFGLLIGSPIAYYIMNKWLADFAYRINMEWWMFLAAGAIALVVAFATVSFQSIRAALVNPADSLRSE